MARVTLIVFPGGFNWPIWVAQERGDFEANGADVDVVPTPGSVHQWTELGEGRAQIAVTLMDNVIAYREGQGEASVVVPDAIAVMGLDNRAMPSLIAVPSVSRYADLRGKTLAVDAVKTGNALLLIGMLERAGLAPGDYRLERAGGVRQRYEAMLRGDFAGALFNSPFDGLLRDRGFTVLDSAAKLMSRFQGHVVAVRKAWAAEHRQELVGFLRAIVDALAWLYTPANRQEALALYLRNVSDASPSDAETAYSFLFHPVTGFRPDGKIDIEGVREVIALRERHGEPAKALREPAAYCDDSFRTQAFAR